jgi:hypothetical protein
MNLLDSLVTSRVELEGHDGRSGARLERVELADGRRLIVKTTMPAADLGMTVSGDVAGRERGLWAAGHLAALPPAVDHAIVDCWQDDDGAIVTVMRDLGDAVIDWDRRLSRADCERIFGAVAELHHAFAGRAPEGLCSLETYLGAFAPATISPLVDTHSPLPSIILRGWQRAAELLPSDLMAAVDETHADPRRLARTLRDGGTTWVHGDLWPVNVALGPERVTLLDWALGVDGPGALDLATFVAGAASITEPSREQLIDDYQRVAGAVEASALARSLFAVFCMYGWNKALDAAEHPDPAVRSRERADLDWWVRRASEALAGF